MNCEPTVVRVELTLSVADAKNLVDAQFKAMAFVAAASITWGNGDVTLADRCLSRSPEWIARLERAARAALADIAVVNRKDGLHLDTEDALREALSHADPLFGIEDGCCSVGGMAADLGENVNDLGN